MKLSWRARNDHFLVQKSQKWSFLMKKDELSGFDRRDPRKSSFFHQNWRRQLKNDPQKRVLPPFASISPKTRHPPPKKPPSSTKSDPQKRDFATFWPGTPKITSSPLEKSPTAQKMTPKNQKKSYKHMLRWSATLHS